MARRELVPQLARLLWLVLPATMGFAIADLLSDRSSAVRTVALIGLWGGWAVGLTALLVPSTLSLTVVRCLAPAAPVVAIIAAVGGASAGAVVAALAGGVAVTVLVLSAPVGSFMVQGSAYAEEARFLLRPPSALLFGPIPLAWALMAATAAGPMLLACHEWAAGVIVCVVGLPVAALLARRLHRLSRRWLVFVPAGVVIHDQLVLAETSMVRRTQMDLIGPAPFDSAGLDITGAAAGLVLEIALSEPIPVTVAERGRGSATGKVARALLVAPSQPGQVLAEATSRGYPLG